MPLDDQESFASKHLILPKLLYFMLNLVVYSTYTYILKYFHEVWGIPSHMVGYLTGLSALGILGSVFWTMIADRYNCHKTMLLATLLSFVGTYLLMRGNIFLGYSYQFRVGFISFVCIMSSLFTSAFYPLLDNRIMIMLTKGGKVNRESYGRQRLFGALGQSTATLLVGRLYIFFGHDATFVTLTVASAIFALLLLFGLNSEGPASLDNQQKDHTTPLNPKKSIWASLAQILFRFDFPFFLLIIFLTGLTRGVVGNFLPLYFWKVMEFTDWQTALMLQTRLITELAFYFLSKQLTQAFGVRGTLLIGLFAGLLRTFSYAILPTNYPWSLAPLAIELLKGIHSACITAGGVNYVHEFAPPELAATAQGLFSGVHSHLSNSASGFFGGYILQIHSSNPSGYRSLFFYTAILALFGLVLFFMRFYIFKSTKLAS